MKGCSTLVINKIQIKMTIRHDFTFTRMAVIKTDNTCWQEYGETEPLTQCWWECKIRQPLWKIVYQLLKMVNINYHSTQQFLDSQERKMKAYVHTKTSTWMFVVTLFIKAEKWKQFKCPSTGEWLNNINYECQLNKMLSFKKESRSSH